MLVFVSHATADQAQYKNLVFALDQAGVGRWDVQSLEPGASLADQLRAAIERCDLCVFVLTKNSVGSAWCLAELGAFWGAGKRVIILRADEKLPDTSVPPQFRGNLWVRSHQEVVAAIRGFSPQHTVTADPLRRRIKGRRLFQHRGYYPIDLTEKNEPRPNRRVVCQAIEHLLSDVDDQLAATDLVYLRVDNLRHGPDLVDDTYLARYDELVNKYELHGFIEHFDAERDLIFRNYRRMVDDIGDTFKDVYFEVLLHDVRNPLHSVIAARNSEKVSGRKLGDPSTRFVVNYVRNQGRDLIAAMEGGSKVAYLKQFTRSKKVKATTTPVYDDVYGLVGIFCMNIDVEAVESLATEGVRDFVSNYIANSGETPAFEREQWGLQAGS